MKIDWEKYYNSKAMIFSKPPVVPDQWHHAIRYAEQVEKFYRHSFKIRSTLKLKEDNKRINSATMLLMQCVSENFEVYPRFVLNQIIDTYYI